MKMFKSIVPIVGLCLFGCATTTEIPANYKYTELYTPDFDFASWQKITDKTAAYKVYIEGDGHSFNTNKQPTDNPTPYNRFVRETAFGDNNPNVIYLARACQFIQHKKCAQKYWTAARFAPEVVDAEADALKQIVGSSPVVLVGFSGGAQIAGLMAVRHPEIKVKKIITIAGNLNHPAWTKMLHVLPLTESLDLNKYKAEFLNIPQIHYVGAYDDIMPPSINQRFVEGKAKVIEVEGATHNSGWSVIIPKVRAE